MRGGDVTEAEADWMTDVEVDAVPDHVPVGRSRVWRLSLKREEGIQAIHRGRYHQARQGISNREAEGQGAEGSAGRLAAQSCRHGEDEYRGPCVDTQGVGERDRESGRACQERKP